MCIADGNITATVGTGNRLGDVAQGLYNKAEQALPHGVCPYVGVGGYAAFGGYGYTARQWGLTLDRMVGEHLVLANGTVVDVSSTHYPDLFWAVGGAALSFRIALSYTFATLPAPPLTFYIYYFSGSASDAASALRELQSFGPLVDPKLGLELVMHGDLNCIFTGFYPDSSSDLSAALGPFLSKLGTPTSTDVHELAWIHTSKLWAVQRSTPLLPTRTMPATRSPPSCQSQRLSPLTTPTPSSPTSSAGPTSTRHGYRSHLIRRQRLRHLRSVNRHRLRQP